MKKSNIAGFLKFLILFSVFSAGTLAQTEAPKPKPHVKKVPAPATPKTPKTPRTDVTPAVSPVEAVEPIPAVRSGGNVSQNESDIPFEKSIDVDSKVNVGFCVTEGNLKVNGWDRDEIRVFINGGSKAGFKIIKKNTNGKPNWLTILGFEPVRDKRTNFNPCLSGDEIEIDLPFGSRITELRGVNDVTVTIDSISRVDITNNEGDILLTKIKDGVKARTFEGNISVENSGGTIFLDSTNGNVLAYRVGSDEIGDNFKAKTNSGTIVLQSIKHSIVEASSISGFIKYSGDILTEGQYSFSNTGGQIMLAIPKESSCMFQIISGKGKFSTEVPLTNVNENFFYPSMQKIVGKIGEGDANIVLVTQNGFIKIKKID